MNRSEIELLGEDWPGTFEEVGLERLNETHGEPASCLDIFVWGSEVSSARVGPILEMLGNKTVKLIGRYRFRYDPPRSASTGTAAAPKGDYHLFDGSEEIAAWDSEGKARHGFPRGHRLPKKAFDAITSRYPGVHGLKGRVLEHCLLAIADGQNAFLIDLNGPDHQGRA